MVKSQHPLNNQVYKPGVMVYHYNQTNCFFLLEACVQPPRTRGGGGGGAAVHRLTSGKGA